MTMAPDESQTAVDEVVTSWPEVKAKSVFGHRGYVRGRRMFGFLPDSGVSVKVTSPQEIAALYARDGVVAFVYNDGMPMRTWPILPLRSSDEFDAAVDALRRAYEATV